MTASHATVSPFSLKDPCEHRDQSRPAGLRRDQRHHLLVAGTGRAGTSALVRYLTGLGLETHLSRRGPAASWDDAAQAGLEDLPLSTVTPDLPYVVKSPWSYQFVQEMLDDPAIAIDGVIVPIRDLGEAAASRTVLQLQALHQEAPWMTQMVTTWEHWGTTPGGSIFSLNPTDEARLLAVGFHRLVERLVHADVPIVLLAFPRLVTDAAYLHRKLDPVLPVHVPAERAQAVHAATFRAADVRIGREAGAEKGFPAAAGEMQCPTLQALDNAALKREVDRLRAQAGATAAQCEALLRERNTLRAQLPASRSRRFTKTLRMIAARLTAASRNITPTHADGESRKGFPKVPSRMWWK